MQENIKRVYNKQIINLTILECKYNKLQQRNWQAQYNKSNHIGM